MKSTNAITWDNWKIAFMTSVKLAAQKCGEDISGLEIGSVTLDRTWGDREGLVFTGADDATLARVCAYFEAWQAKHMGHLYGYGCQRAPHYGAAPIRVWEIVKTYPCVASPFETDLPAGVKVGDRYEDVVSEWLLSEPNLEAWAWAKARSGRTGLAISHCYYPCAD